MNIKIIVGFILGTVILIGGSYALLTLTDTASKIESSSNVKAIITSKTDHDWGTIGINDGKVSATYTIKNDGTEPHFESSLNLHFEDQSVFTRPHAEVFSAFTTSAN